MQLAAPATAQATGLQPVDDPIAATFGAPETVPKRPQYVDVPTPVGAA